MNNFRYSTVVVNDEVATAVREGRGVVALETTIVVQGLPQPINLEVAAQCEAAVRAGSSVPATIGVLGGTLFVGLTSEQLTQLADPTRSSLKLSSRDLGLSVAMSRDGATTVAGTVSVATRVGIEVMATGGLGGVHRDAATSFDESADLVALSRTPVMVVASGVKSILDIAATLERLDTLGVPVVGYRTKQFPGFYRSESGFPLEWSVTSPEDAASVFASHREFSSTGFLLANPVHADAQLSEATHQMALEGALEKVHAQGVSGKDVTPVLLAEFARLTGGVSVEVNRELVVANARLAGEVATALARLRG